MRNVTVVEEAEVFRITVLKQKGRVGFKVLKSQSHLKTANGVQNYALDYLETHGFPFVDDHPEKKELEETAHHLSKAVDSLAHVLESGVLNRFAQKDVRRIRNELINLEIEFGRDVKQKLEEKADDTN